MSGASNSSRFNLNPNFDERRIQIYVCKNETNKTGRRETTYALNNENLWHTN